MTTRTPIISDVVRVRSGNVRPTAAHVDFPSNNKFGVEIELENCNYERAFNEDFSHWTVVEESSLRGEGCELIFSRPLNGALVNAALAELDNSDVVQEAECSWRCGLHIHIDVRKWETDKLQKFVALYLIKEREIFNKLGAERWVSNFCIPLTKCHTYKAGIFSHSLTGGQMMPIMHWNKYSAMNLRPMFDGEHSTTSKGSIEFRGARSMKTAADVREAIQVFDSLIVQADSIEPVFGTDEFFIALNEMFPQDFALVDEIRYHNLRSR